MSVGLVTVTVGFCRIRYQAMVSRTAVASGVVGVEKKDSYLRVSRTKGCSNS